MITMINSFELPADQVDAFLADWRHRGELMSTQPGFLDFQLHRSLAPDARFKVVNVAHWESREALAAAMNNPEFEARIQALTANPDLSVSANPAVYEVVLSSADFS